MTAIRSTATRATASRVTPTGRAAPGSAPPGTCCRQAGGPSRPRRRAPAAAMATSTPPPMIDPGGACSRPGSCSAWLRMTIGDDLTVGRVGYGAMQLTGPKEWGDYPDRSKAIALLREVVDAGVTFIDTADVYGPHA